MNNIGRGLQHACDQVYAAREGKTAEVLYAELHANVRGRNLTIPDANLHAYAAAMADGRRVRVKVKGI